MIPLEPRSNRLKRHGQVVRCNVSDILEIWSDCKSSVTKYVSRDGSVLSRNYLTDIDGERWNGIQMGGRLIVPFRSENAGDGDLRCPIFYCGWNSKFYG